MQIKRWQYALGFVLLFIIEVFIALYVHDNFVRPYLGDVLVVVVIYCFIRILIPNKVKLMPLYIFLFAVSIEILQSLRLIEILGLQNNTFLKILLGSVFDFKDIICYGIGCAIIAILSIIINRNSITTPHPC